MKITDRVRDAFSKLFPLEHRADVVAQPLDSMSPLRVRQHNLNKAGSIETSRHSQGMLKGIPSLPTDPTLAFIEHLSLFQISTAFETWLGVDETQNNSFSYVGIRSSRTQADLILCVPNRYPQCSFLLAADGRRISVLNDSIASEAVSTRVSRDRLPEHVMLVHPQRSERCLGIVDVIPNAHPVRAMFDRLGDTVLDFLKLHQIDHTDVVPVWPLLNELAIATSQTMTASHVLDLLHTGKIRPGLAETMIRVLPFDELKLLALRLTGSAVDRELLARCMPHDPWIVEILPAAIDWDYTGRASVSTSTAPATQDDLISLDSPKSPGWVVNILARRAIPPRRMAAAFTKARNDGAYLLDWIAYHRSIGFDHIFIYSNDNDDGSDTLLDLLAHAGMISWVNSEILPGTNPQDKANQHILTMVPQLLDYRWVINIDSDEYLGLSTRFKSVSDYLGWQEQREVDAIALCWLIFGALETDGWSEAGSVDRFSQRQPTVNGHVKSIMRTNRFSGAQPHFPFAVMGEHFVFRTEAGAIHHVEGITNRLAAFAETPSAEHAWINHYIFRSCLEAVWKLNRGRADWSESTEARRAEHMDFTINAVLNLSDPANLIDDRRCEIWLPGRDAELRRLRALPGVADCEAAIKSQFACRLRATASAFLDLPAISQQHQQFRQMIHVLLAKW